MDILLDNPLANMYGPYFLLLYGTVIIFALITLAVVRSLIDRTDKLPSPTIPTKIDPYEIAYLRGGINELARSVVFSLIQKDLLEIFTVGKHTRINRSNISANLSAFNNIEKITYEWFGKGRDVGDIFKSTGLNSQLAAFADQYKTRLEQQQLLADADLFKSYSIFKWLAALMISSLGFYKLITAISHGRYNIIFLLIFGVAGLILTAVLVNMPRVTKLGKAYLERLQLAFESVKSKAQIAYQQSENKNFVPQNTFAGVDPLLLSVGVFGGGILAGTMFDSYNQAFHKSQQVSSTGSCGSSCGSCSSSDGGGSSCSGGSSCGGGCGGGGCGS